MATYVLVPGANHGGWCFDDLAERLRGEGHEVHAPTLPGLGEGESAAGINLDTHLDALAALVEPLGRVVLAGHSYGGMLVSGIADRLPEHVDSLVYLDALVPRDGENCWAIVNDEERAWYVDVDETGFGTPPLPFFDDRARPHPLGTFLQRISLKHEVPPARRRIFLYATRWPGESPLETSYRRVRDDPAWEVHELDSAHNFMRDVPDRLAQILLDASR